MEPKTNSVVIAGVMLAGVNGLIAVIMGAVGAHGLSDDQAARWIATGSMFQLAHAAALIGLAAFAASPEPRYRGAVPTIVICLTGGGAITFASALYATAFGGLWAESIGWAAPWGGLAMIIGWGLLIVHGIVLITRR